MDVSESASPEERFSLPSAFDPDVGINTVDSYRLSNSDHFTIDIHSGSDGTKYVDLVLMKALDREEQAVHNLILTAVDGGVPARSGTANIIVRVLDTNDNAPQFDRTVYSVNMSENSPIGTLVTKLNASDVDEGSNAEITYSFTLYTSEKTQEVFDLNSKTGEITVKGTVDFEDMKIFEMHIEAKDNGPIPLSGQCRITLHIMDMNDNYPEITIKSLKNTVKEDIPVGTVIALVAVSDRDTGDNGKVNLTINKNLPFTLNKSSDYHYELVVSENLDREIIPEYEITLQVTDGGNPPLSDNETITVHLLDINDNAPQFPLTFYSITVMENNAPGALLSSLTANDPDLHENQYLVYFIIEKEIVNTSMSMLFSINPENGNLYALKTFDYEIEKEFLFHIEARDSGVPPLSSNVTVHIIIMDQNDNTPAIVSPWRAHGSVVEEKIPRSTDKGTLIAKVIAIDTDSVHNSRITYQFLQNTDATLFSLDQYNGEIRTMRMFSYRDSRHQRLVVIAKDNGEPSLSATVTIKLSTVETALKTYADMTEVPLEYDIFSDLNLYLVIGLGSVSFLLLITILVTIVLKCQKPKPSKAAPPCRNSVISERNSTIADSTLVSNDAYWYSLFLAETRKGKLVVRQPVPKGARYIVSSIPRSTGLTETSDSAASTLQVIENNAPGALLSSLTAHDPDLHENQYLVYFIIEKEIVNTSMSMLFSINPENGNLYALKTFDYEIEKEFLFHIEARDSGVPPLSSNVTVHIIIMDQNDNTPVIVSPWRARGSVVEEKIPRSTDKGTLIAKVIAIDTDSVHNSRIMYQFLQNTDATLFSLDQYNGEIRTMRMFSYRDSRHQRLVVIAKDNGEPSLSATVTIKLSTVETALKTYADMTEVPLEYDIFSDLNLYLVIGLGSVSFLLLITIFVTIVLKCQKPKPSKAAPPCRNSVISERNSTIADSTLVSNDAYWYSLFLAETRKGKLVVRQPVPKGARYIVSSIPRSTGLTETSDSAASTLQVIENNAPGALLSSLTAHDPDLHENQYLVYFIIEKEIVNTSMSMLFSINPENGNLYALKTFDYEIEKEFLFHIEARDSGVPPLSSNVTVHIIIMDQNDNTPVIVSPWRARGSVVEEKIPRSTDKGTLIAKVIAIDTDSVHNSRIMYQFLQNTDATLFSLDQYNGEIRTMRMFSYRDSRHQRLVVIAKDNGEPSLSATVTIKLSTVETALKTYADMTEVPLEYDIFSDLNLYLVIGLGSVSFLLLITIFVTIVLKCQKPKPSKAAPPCRNSVISERNSTIADSTLVSNDAYWYSLFLAETRKGKLVVRQPVPKGARYIVSSIPRSTGLTETSDSAASTLQVMENNAPGALLSSLTAYDPDLHENQYLVYFIIEKEIVNTSMSMLFSINPENGNLYALKTFDYEIEKEFLFHIEARDSGVPPLSSNVTVHIIIMDQNDNTPVIVSPWRAHGSVVEEKIPRSTDKGTLIAKVIAIDTDSVHNSRITYQFLQNTDATLFSLDQYNGEIRTMRMFSYRDSRHQRLVVIAKDNGEPSLSATVTIKLSTVETALKTYADMTEVPLEYDIFSDLNLYLVIGLGSVSFLLLITILVTIVLKCQKPKPSKAAPPCRNSVISERNSTIADSTLVSNDAYWYSLFLAETRKGKLVVRQPVPKGARYIVSSIPRSTGLTETSDSAASTLQLLVSEPLDREKVPEYDITFTVTDRGTPPLSDNETVTLELLDINDNVPQFAQSFYTIQVIENNAPGALLSSLTAHDPDLHENQYLVYFIIEKEIVNTSMSMLFSINPENGNLYALKTFDYEIEKEFLFHIEARDSGVPPLSSNVTVHIIIIDQNDNTPVIVSPWRAHGSVVEEKIPRSTDKGTLIAKVIAIDTDSVHNSRITYQFLQNTDATLFSLDQYNGEIRTMRMFSYRDSRHQRLVVIAKDNGEPSLSATVTIKLSTVETALKTYADMTEVPLEYDIFSDLNLYLVIGLGSVSFLLLITILVTIVLKCQKPKPSKAAPPCRNSVISERNSTIADSTLVSNDAYWYSLFLAETRKGKLVVRQPVPKGARYIVSSIPRSTGLSETSDSAASTLQEIVNTSMSMLFSINPENGNLYALKTFDYEIEKEFLFHIEARDSGVPPLSSNVTVHIIIMDQNDNTPAIVSPWRAHGSVVEEKIPRSTDKGTLIAKVIAIDTDSVHNSRITYQFLQNTDATLFSLDQYNGEIRTMRMFSYRDSRHQRLVVAAKDNGEPALSATVTIKLSTVETALKTYGDMTEVPLEYDIFSDLNLYLVIGLGSVSFLLLITILVTIVLKCQKPKPSKVAPPCRNSVISERNSTIADSTLVSNDAYWYSLFLAETRKGKLVVRQPVPKGARYIVSSIPRSTGLTETSDSAASTLQVG
ncbi:hypothetical protein P4O66_002543 [Electrophorus voltai]|uniref:Cadherin domain-containing protein n=1 Tax=Electrophorus voltai TaxID=2609070 RepID=A0AAD8YX77_9TELE|nr:hypothetical protein P4O66_002543 [Electrophorus voltai]